MSPHHLLRGFAVFLAAHVAPVSGNVPGGGAKGPAVTITETRDTLILANGLLSATIGKSGARITSLRFKDFEMLNDGYYSMDGGKAYRNPNHCVYTVKTATDNQF